MQVFLKTTSTGVCIMLHGLPGTGKTEYVLQVAIQTNRPIFKVDISSTKNMYYGESEKMIKRIFTDYNNMLMGADVTPILFINEADALISTRVNVKQSVDQTNNSIQNVLLEELENFRGILIITTNLVNNMDKAFERRFLMKLKFDKANQEAQSQIWKDKLPQLEKYEIEKLLSYDLSPALIDNVAKKCFIKTLIDGEANFADIRNFCAEETFSTSNKKIIGF
jgi:SpoVK/Ycf46/Vps4 family AAA+-type ATPase